MRLINFKDGVGPSSSCSATRCILSVSVPHALLYDVSTRTSLWPRVMNIGKHGKFQERNVDFPCKKASIHGSDHEADDFAPR